MPAFFVPGAGPNRRLVIWPYLLAAEGLQCGFSCSPLKIRAAMEIPTPYLLFLGDAKDDLAAKTASGIKDWRPDLCVGQMRLPGCLATLGLPDLTYGEARAQGARTLVIGVVNPGGVLPETWGASLREAQAHGFHLASGLHHPLAANDLLAEGARETGTRLIEVRQPQGNFPTGSGEKRPGNRLLTVGTDCSCGKKYTALALHRDLQARSVPSTFRATGQTGILIAGGGVPIDAVVSDFIAGAAEGLSPAAPDDHWDVIEGQGSLFHPSFAGVTLGLLHGSQPDAFVVCHEPTRTKMRNVQTPLPSIGAVIDMTEKLGRLTNPNIRCVGIALNSAKLTEAQTDDQVRRLEQDYNVPVCDPIRHGTNKILDYLLAVQ